MVENEKLIVEGKKGKQKSMASGPSNLSLVDEQVAVGISQRDGSLSILVQLSLHNAPTRSL